MSTSDFFDHHKIENKWIKVWGKKNIYVSNLEPKKKKFYCLDMYPYPSGFGLHMGHMEGYTASDIFSRYMRMRGYNVLHPMGWDAFGLPAENFAIKTGVHPLENTRKAIDNFRNQEKALGLSYDWNREFSTTDPSYYKWTQWLFLLLYKEGLAYRGKAPVNWCPSCQTVLANEQVVNGKCERCESDIEMKEMEQWFFKVTAYADRLIEGLERIDWPKSTKIAQLNWIGKKEGVIIRYEVVFPNKRNSLFVECFTTRPETNFGSTFIVASPFSSFVRENINIFPNKSRVEEYIKNLGSRKDRTGVLVKSDNKSGVFTGLYASNPLTSKKLPIFVSDYVLEDVGTGVVVGVPGHDLRDFLFAKSFGLDVVRVILGPGKCDKKICNADDVYEGEGVVVNSKFLNGLSTKEAKKKIVSYIEEKGFGRKSVQYKIRDWIVSRQRYWGAPIPIIYCKNCGTVPVPEKDLPILLPTDISADNLKPKGKSPLELSKSFNKGVTCPKCGKKAVREKDTLDTFVDSSWYYFRFTDPKNDKEFASRKALKYWMPVDLYIGGAEHTVGHLIYARFITKVLYDEGLIDFDEPFLKLRHQGMILGEDGRKMSKRWGNVITPDDVVRKVGADAARIYVMFMGPLKDVKKWSTKGLEGARRFIERVWRARSLVGQKKPTKDQEVAINRLIKEVSENVEKLKFNIAVSKFMTFLNRIFEWEKVPQSVWRRFILVLAPFAPFITEELWEMLGEKESIHKQNWPTADSNFIFAEKVLIGVQVNGKIRGRILVTLDTDEKEALDAALKIENIRKYVFKKDNIRKVVYVKGRILSIVTKS